MPFIINHIDNLLLAVELAIKVSRFILATIKVMAKVIHFSLLFVGGAVIVLGYWAYDCYQFVNGKAPTYASIDEAEHGEQPQEFASPAEVSPEQFIAASILANPIDWDAIARQQVQDWVLEDSIAPIVPIKTSHKGKGGRRRKSLETA